MNKKILIVSLVLFLGLSIAIYQYAKELQSEFTSAAYSTSKPANGHSWSEMECTSDLCVTGGKIGMGTDSPSKKLSVVGDIGASGDICNGTGNCLSALATLTNACGAAATTYVYSASAYSGTYCVMGTPTPASPSWPSAGNSTTWTCPVTSGSPISCTATHSPAPVAGVCGAAATAYPYSASAYSGALCSTGTASPTTPAFPAVGSSSSWSCLGINGGSSPSCTASRNNPASLVNSVHTEASCVSAGGEVVASDVSYNQCRFNASSCPSGWAAYGHWTTTTPGTIPASSVRTCGSCSISACSAGVTGSHAWANTATIESGASQTDEWTNTVGACYSAPSCEMVAGGTNAGCYSLNNLNGNGGYGTLWGNRGSTGYATITQIGCY
jgi:hypothetical protein